MKESESAHLWEYGLSGFWAIYIVYVKYKTKDRHLLHPVVALAPHMEFSNYMKNCTKQFCVSDEQQPG